MRKIILVMIGYALVLILTVFGIQLLWNWLMPELFGVQEVNFWQACGIYVLSNLLFKKNDIKFSLK